jgi:hypothetical protein
MVLKSEFRKVVNSTLRHSCQLHNAVHLIHNFSCALFRAINPVH